MMRLRWLVPVVLLLVAACGPEPYYIGVMLEPAGVDAARLGVLEVNFRNGIDGRPLRLRMFRLTPTTSRETVADTLRKWARDSSMVAALVTSGHASAQEVSRMLSRGGLPHLFMTSEPPPAAADPNRFHMVPSAQDEARFMAEQSRLRPDARVAVIYPDNPTGHAMHQSLAERLRALGTPLVAQAMYPSVTDESQLLGLAGEVVETDPDIVYWIGDVAELTAVFSRLRSGMMKGVVIANNRAETRHLYFNPDGHYTGLRFVRLVDVRGRGDEMRDFDFRNMSWSGGETTSRDVLTYDAVIMLAEGIRTAGGDRAAVRDYLTGLREGEGAFRGVAGPVAFTLPGQLVPREFHLAQVLSGGVRMSRDLEPPYQEEEETAGSAE